MVELTEYVLTRLQKEEAFVMSEEKNVAAGGTFNIHIRNPSGSDRTLIIPTVTPTTKGEATFRVYDNFDSITEGTDIVVQNATMDSDNGAPDEGPMEVYMDSTFVEAENSEHAGGVIGSGGGGSTAAGGGTEFPPMRVEEGREIVIELTNDSGSAYDMNLLAFALI